MAPTARASGNVETKAPASKRRPENLPAHPWQYLARSLLGVWHESQYFVISGLLRNFVRRHDAKMRRAANKTGVSWGLATVIAPKHRRLRVRAAARRVRNGDGLECRITELAVGAAGALDITLPRCDELTLNAFLTKGGAVLASRGLMNLPPFGNRELMQCLGARLAHLNIELLPNGNLRLENESLGDS